MYKSMFRPEVIRRVELCFFRPCAKLPSFLEPPRGYLCWTLNFCLYKPCAMCLSWLHFQPCAGSEPDCNCCLSNKYTYMQLRSPEVTRVNFHLSKTALLILSTACQTAVLQKRASVLLHQHWDQTPHTSESCGWMGIKQETQEWSICLLFWRIPNVNWRN